MVSSGPKTSSYSRSITRRNNLRRHEIPGGAVWNAKTKEWVFAVWVEVDNPALATSVDNPTGGTE